MFYLNQKDTDPKIVSNLASAYERLQNRLDKRNLVVEAKPVDTLELARMQERSQKRVGPSIDLDPSEPPAAA